MTLTYLLFETGRNVRIMNINEILKQVIPFLKERRRRIAMSLAGVIICAVSVGIFKLAALGVDPFQSFMSGISLSLPTAFCRS